ncbi:MAG TPA: hypothetical protein DCX12_09215 [Chloroflexi bacterium]|nr:hypothetical protein [Chloroflexota bacterium]
MSARRRFAPGEFIFPETRGFPIPDPYHATLALSSLMRIAGRHGVSSESRARARAVLEAVRERFPQVYAGERELVAEIHRAYGAESRPPRTGAGEVIYRRGL